jgi:serine/threonine-protein kinase RsbW
VKIDFTVTLPVDAQSVPLVRGLVRQALEHLEVVAGGIEEVVLALTEACAHVVHHAGDQEEYQVDVSIDDHVCRISVLDDGPGFDVDSIAAATPPSPLDGGRGLVLMRALVDELDFRETADGRHGVFLEKSLVTSPRLRLLSLS